MDRIVKRLDVIILLLAVLAVAVLWQAGYLKFNENFVRYWYFHVPNFVLAALMYTLLGRVALSLVIEHNSQNYIWRFFCRLTDPVVNAVALVTPKAAAPVIIWLFAFVWLFWIRVAVFALFAMSGLAPRVSG